MKQLIKFQILLLLIFTSVFTKAQELETKDFKIGISGGLAVYFEKELKDINSEAIKNLPFNVETLNNFPPSFCYGAYVLNKFGNRIAIGPSYNFYTTGSRIGTKDYSGTYSFDQILSAHSLGVQFEILLLANTKSKVYFENIAGANFATWKIEETFILGEEKSNDLQELRAIKPFIYPGIKFLWPITNDLKIIAKAGASIDLAGKFSLKENSQAKSEIKANFTGPRITIGIEYGY